MFTGIIEATGKVLQIDKTKHSMHIRLQTPFTEVNPGESIAVDGVCLTAINIQNGVMEFDISSETLDKTYFRHLVLGAELNLEQAMLSQSRFGGHYVSGHVDTTAQVRYFEQLDNYVKLVVDGFSSEQMKYLLPKGSITLNGVSLTINALVDGGIELMLVPHTLEMTTLRLLKVGQLINVEFDFMARMIAHQIEHFLARQMN
jgi:riboflavin synthase